jgi:molecular chaperone GrpE (heat shock protein)
MADEKAVENNGDPTAPTELTEETQDFAEKVSKLEKIIRGMGRDSLSVVRGQKDIEATLQIILSRLDDLELLTKGTTQTIWRATQENQKHLQGTQDHFAGAIRELESRVREEMQWQFRQSTLEAIGPALDDMDLVIAMQSALTKNANEKDDFLEAMMLVRRKFSEGLKALGLEEIVIEEGLTRFDPNLHEAVESDIPDALLEGEGLVPGTIILVRRAGFGFNGRVIRVPQVLVVK